MVKAKRESKNLKKKPAAPTYDSDDERAYEGESVPDKMSSDYYNDEIDNFHVNKEKLLLEKGASYGNDEDSGDNQEEVMGFSDSEEEAMYEAQLNRLKGSKVTEELASDIEEGQDDKDMPNDRAWGKLKSKFYGADMDDDQDADFSGSEAGVAALEEQEAVALQKKMAEQLDADDFGLAGFQALAKVSENQKEDASDRVVKDVSKLSKREKRELLKKECPELLDILNDYKQKLLEYSEKLEPLLLLIHEGRIPPASSGAVYVKTKACLIRNYCVNVQFYLQLRIKQIPVRNHPIIKRLVQYRNLMKQLAPLEERQSSEMEAILNRLKNGEEIKSFENQLQSKAGKHKPKALNKLEPSAEDDASSSVDDEDETGTSVSSVKLKQQGTYETTSEKQALEFYKMMKPSLGASAKIAIAANSTIAGRVKDSGVNMEATAEGGHEQDRGSDGDGEQDDANGTKRAATYQIVKNRGLTPRRKKEYKNPRVKHRIKYQKAKVRRKGQVREPRKEMQRYGGEISGIRAGIKRSVKLKC